MTNTDLVESFSGIRGIYNQSITQELAQQYAWAYLKLFKNNRDILIVGGDSRSSTLVLKKTFVKIFTQAGVQKIIDIGVAPIQVCQYAVLKFKAQGGVYITASHNEPEYNGWKFLKEDGALLFVKQSTKLIQIVHQIHHLKTNGRLPVLLKSRVFTKRRTTSITNRHQIAIKNYINFILQRIGFKNISQIKKAKFQILVDPNGGSAIVVLSKLFKKLGVEAKIINNKLGKFSRLIEPNEESLAYLGPNLRTGRFAFACGFDCDADRVELVLSPNSQFAKNMGSPIVSGNYVLALACEAILAGTQNQIIITNDATSYLISDVVKKYQAKIKEAEVGEMAVVEKMEKYKSLIGGEGSNGGVIIPPIKCRDGIMTVVLILKIIAERGQSLVEILKTYPRYFSQRVKLICSPAQSIKIKNKLESYYKAKGFKIKKTGGTAGSLKIIIDQNSFLWFRQSRTEGNVLRLIVDGDEKEKIKRILEKGGELIEKILLKPEVLRSEIKK